MIERDGDSPSADTPVSSSPELHTPLKAVNDMSVIRSDQMSVIPSSSDRHQVGRRQLDQQMQMARAHCDRSIGSETQIPSRLPKLQSGLMFLCAVASVVVIAQLAPPRIPILAELILRFTSAAYLTFGLLRLSEVYSRWYGVSRPLSRWMIWILALLSCMCQPTSLIWNIIQFVWVISMGRCILKSDDRKMLSWLPSLSLALLVCAVPLISGYIWTCLLLAILSQFACLFFLCETLRTRVSGVQDQRLAGKVANRFVHAEGMIPYHAFAAITRWKQQQQESLRSDMSNMVLLPILIVLVAGTVFTLGFAFRRPLFSIVRGNGSQVSHLPAAFRYSVPGESVTHNHRPSVATSKFGIGGDIASLKADSSFAELIGVGSMCSVILILYIVCSKPTHIKLTAKGWQFAWRRRWMSRDGRLIDWKDIVRIYLESPKGTTSPLNQRLCFFLKDRRVCKLAMGSIESVEDREQLLTAIQNWAPEVSRDPSVTQALLPPPNHSYTELWLQALSAPPKRERLQPLASGVRLRGGRYKVLSQLGAGGQGQAYLAQQTGDGKEIVLKEFILPVYVDTKVRRSALEQFENEARILRQLDHQQIVKLNDFFVEDHRGYLVLEHISGASLRHIVSNEGRLSESKVCALALQMCDILAYLHGLAKPVVHRDFTPENLIVKADGTLTLIDFNVAKQVVEFTTTGTVVGKPAYLPPEQFRGMPEPRSDIYAMGGTMHFLLTGQDPEPLSVSHPGQVCPDVSDWLNQLVERTTALDTEKRYAAASAVKADLMANLTSGRC